MKVKTPMRWVGSSMMTRAELMGHEMKDKALERRVDRLASENDELKTENRVLRDEVKESRSDLQRILDMLEKHTGSDDDRSHKGLWFLFLMLLAGAGYAASKMMGGDPMMDRGGGRSADGTTGMSDASMAA